MKASTYNGDTMSTNAGVALEDNVGALVDSKAVILVVDSAMWNVSYKVSAQVSDRGDAHLSSMMRSVVLQSKPSVL